MPPACVSSTGSSYADAASRHVFPRGAREPARRHGMHGESARAHPRPCGDLGPSVPHTAPLPDAETREPRHEASPGHADAAPVSPYPLPDPVVRRIPFGDERFAYVVTPRTIHRPARLLAMIHGLCTPPSYVCGDWKGAASSFGVLVCPTGNALCGPGEPAGPTWDESFAAMDGDVELAVAATRRKIPEVETREGAVLAGFSEVHTQPSFSPCATLEGGRSSS